QAVPRKLCDHPHPKPVARVGAGEDVLCVNRVRVDELLHPLQQAVELLAGDGLVAWMPPDGVLARRLLDEELVLRRPAGVLPGLGGQGAGGDDGRLTAPDRVLVECGRAEVPPSDRDLAFRGHRFRIGNEDAPAVEWGAPLLSDAGAAGAGPAPLLAAHVV